MHQNFSEINFYVFFSFSDISVFIGARSDLNQSDCFWNDGSSYNVLPRLRSNSYVCQQMTWPLSYDDGINLRRKECGSGISHYVCKAKCNSYLR